MDTFLAAGGGFLAAVLWMDLMFDVLALGGRGQPELPEQVLAQIAGYYRRVTTEATPMNYAIGAVMVAMVVALGADLARGGGPLRALSLALCSVPVALALTRIFPNAIRLGTGERSPREQTMLARSICRDHLVCFAAMLAFLATRWLAA